MQKKVYVSDLSLKEVFERLRKGEYIYYNDCDEIYYKDVDGFITRFRNGKPTTVGIDIPLNDSYYFLDEVEADESCVGKLCKFWDNSNEIYPLIAVLKEYIPDNQFKYLSAQGIIFLHCRPLSAAEVQDLTR